MAVTTFSTSQERQKCANKEQGCGDDGKQGNRDRDTYGGDQHQHCRGHGPHDRASPAPTSPTRQKNKVDQPSPTTVSAPSASKKPPIPPTTNANAELMMPEMPPMIPSTSAPVRIPSSISLSVAQRPRLDTLRPRDPATRRAQGRPGHHHAPPRGAGGAGGAGGQRCNFGHHTNEGWIATLVPNSFPASKPANTRSTKQATLIIILTS
jgi:hypothetical protein